MAIECRCAALKGLGICNACAAGLRARLTDTYEVRLTKRRPSQGALWLVAKWKATADHIKAESDVNNTLATATYATLRGCADELEQLGLTWVGDVMCPKCQEEPRAQVSKGATLQKLS